MIYFYWGNKTLSFLRFMTLCSACKFNDKVTLVLRRGNPIVGEWTEKQDFNSYSNIDYTSWLNHLYLENLRIEYLEDNYKEIAELNAPEIHTSDLLAWYILARKGGTISDMDILFTKPIPPVHHDVCLVSFEKWPKADYIPVSFMQGRPNQFFEKTYQQALERYDPKVYESCGQPAIGHFFDYIPIKSYKKKRLHSKIVFPFAEDCEWKHYRRMMFEEKHALPDECIGIHWYAGRNQDYNNWITHKNYKDYNCTITEAIKGINESFNF